MKIDKLVSYFTKHQNVKRNDIQYVEKGKAEVSLIEFRVKAVA